MKVTPLDIQQHHFSKRLNGYDSKEVKDFLELVAVEMEKLVRELQSLREAKTHAERQLIDFKERESILKDTLVTAQKMTSDIKNTAHKESEIIIGQAKVQAEKIINMANQRLAKLIDDVNELRRQRARLQSDLKNTLENHYKLLEIVAEDQDAEQRPEEKIKVIPTSK